MSELGVGSTPEMAFLSLSSDFVVRFASSSASVGNGSMTCPFAVSALLGAEGRPVSSVSEFALFRCVCSFHPSEPYEPLLMSASDGALIAVVPVAAHIPGGGLASIKVILAARILLATVGVVGLEAFAFAAGEAMVGCYLVVAMLTRHKLIAPSVGPGLAVPGFETGQQPLSS